MTVQWSVTDLGTGITISSGTVATANTGGADTCGRATASFSVPVYYEASCTVLGGSTGARMGFADAAAVLNNALGAVSDAVGVNTNGAFYGGAAQSDGTWSAGDRVALAIHIGNQRFWWKNLTTASAWHPSGDPNTLTGGLDLTGVTFNSPVFPAYCLHDLNDSITGFFTPASFLGAIPTGFQAADPATTQTLLPQVLM